MIKYKQDEENLNHIGGFIHIASYITAAGRAKLV